MILLQSRGLMRSSDKFNVLISICTGTIATKHTKVVIYHEELSLIKSNNTLNKWSRDKSNILDLHYQNAYNRQIGQEGDFP